MIRPILAHQDVEGAALPGQAQVGRDTQIGYRDVEPVGISDGHRFAHRLHLAEILWRATGV